MSLPLIETDPELVEAAGKALDLIEPSGPELARETIFVHKGKKWWTKMTMDPIANTVEKWDIFPRVISGDAEISYDGKHFESLNRPL